MQKIWSGVCVVNGRDVDAGNDGSQCLSAKREVTLCVAAAS